MRSSAWSKRTVDRKQSSLEVETSRHPGVGFVEATQLGRDRLGATRVHLAIAGAPAHEVSEDRSLALTVRERREQRRRRVAHRFGPAAGAARFEVESARRRIARSTRSARVNRPDPRRRSAAAARGRRRSGGPQDAGPRRRSHRDSAERWRRRGRRSTAAGAAAAPRSGRAGGTAGGRRHAPARACSRSRSCAPEPRMRDCAVAVSDRRPPPPRSTDQEYPGLAERAAVSPTVDASRSTP